MGIDDQQIAEYFKSKRVVILSALSTGRDLRKLFLKFGAGQNDVIVAESFAHAKTELAKPSHVLMMELFFEGSNCLDLIKFQEEQFENRLEIATIVLGQGTSNAAVGMIAEDNVDSVLLRPLTIDSFRAALEQALANKIHPTHFWHLIESGKAFLRAGQHDQATAVFQEAKSHHPKPALAFFYLGQIHLNKGQLADALQCFQDGLAFDPKDYRCLIGSLDAKIKQGDWPSAYQIAVQFHSEYPVNMKRIPELVKLSIHDGNYNDIVDYYKIFKDIERKDGYLNKVVVAGLLVCSKYFLRRQDEEMCRNVLKDAAKISLEYDTLRSDVLRYLIEARLYPEADEFLSKLPKDLLSKPDYRFLRMEFYGATSQDELVIKEGNAFLKEGIKSERIFDLMIQSSIKLKRPEVLIDQLKREASELAALAAEGKSVNVWDRFKSLFK